ncbi:ArsA family ATPase [Fluviispira sanaruensis]|uniref:arsenite-transporting ATPase n=1 Tax=Fluviispira sanaruensis TaxID=2493639 RepID=A0A4P2VPI1_FLUSA|nr:ArsA-related P-loop ATPase [Fluviispira sanaruensis]BBH53689.1 adventurous gliding motility protein R [Fluviispira sanaruensis]
MRSSFPKLHVFLGAGGVGKTTLSASFALSLASSGKKVGLLSIDPAKRLQSALGVSNLSERGVLIPLGNNSKGELRAAVLQIGESLSRWVEEKGMPADKQAKLFENPYFSALAEKMASATDTLAAIRIAEWVEQYPDVEELVIDTAPGIHAIDFISKPEKIMAFLDGKLVEWLKWFVGGAQEKQSFFARALKTGARKIIEGLALVGGRNFLINFGEFLTMLDDVFITAIKRLKYSQKWLQDENTQFILVSSIREDAVFVTKELGRILKYMGMNPKLAIINRAFPLHLKNEISFNDFIKNENSLIDSEKLLSNYLANYIMTQQKIFHELINYAEIVIEVPISASLDRENELRLSDLTSLGDVIRKEMR